MTHPIEHGYVCVSCGLSDHGFARFVELHFDPHPCPKCYGHFPPLLGPSAPDEDSSSLRPDRPEDSTDTPDMFVAGTLW